jgi:predicted RND superfamily exporter protein
MDFCGRRSGTVIALALLVAALALAYVSRNFAMDTDTAHLLPGDLPWRTLQTRFEAAFPQQVDRLAVVIDGATPEITDRATELLVARLQRMPVLLKDVVQPAGGPFFQRNGLLFLSQEQLSDALDRVVDAQPLLGVLAADPSMRGLAEATRLFSEGIARAKDAAAADIAPLRRSLQALADGLESVAAGRAVPFSWQTMLSGGQADPRALRQFILLRPLLDYRALRPGEQATAAIRAAARETTLEVTREFGASPQAVTVRLTGTVPLNDEQFASLADRALLNGIATLSGLVLMLWFAVRSAWMIAAMLLTLFAGLAMTTAAGLLMFHSFNLISVAFIALFVGLGIDFCIQLGVAFRGRWQAGAARVGAERAGEAGAGTRCAGEAGACSEGASAERAGADHAREERIAALRAAVSGVGAGIGLAAAATALGFLAFLPTQYRGVSQLGLIAGSGMLIALVLTLTLLPALLARIPLPRNPLATHPGAYARLGRFVERRHRVILIAAALLGAACIALLPRLRFDFNPLHLMSPHGEAVATLRDIGRDPLQTPNTLDALTPSLPDAQSLAARLSALPAVRQCLTLATFVPPDQEAKLAALADAAQLVLPTLDPPAVKPAPGDAEVVQSLHGAAAAWQKLAASAAGDVGALAGRLAAALGNLAEGTSVQRTAADNTFIAPLRTTLAGLRASLQATSVTADNLPADLRREWLAADGRARVQIFPAGDPDDNANLGRFVAAVMAVAPQVSGPPIAIQSSRDTIVGAFIEAALFAGIAIAALLLVTLRHIGHALLALAPLLLAGFVVFGLCASVPIPLDFENIIAFPLLLGIGVAFSIYFVVAWRRGERAILESTLGHAILFSGLTTASAFGSLALSRHPGTASLGRLLALSLACILASVLVVLPAVFAALRRR